jgi:hypothetical protein
VVPCTIAERADIEPHDHRDHHQHLESRDLDKQLYLVGQVRELSEKNESTGQTEVNDSPLNLASRGANDDRQGDRGSGMLARSFPRRFPDRLCQRDIPGSRFHSPLWPHSDHSSPVPRVAWLAWPGLCSPRMLNGMRSRIKRTMPPSLLTFARCPDLWMSRLVTMRNSTAFPDRLGIPTCPP